jgi:hypothetical protein
VNYDDWGKMALLFEKKKLFPGKDSEITGGFTTTSTHRGRHKTIREGQNLFG